LERVRRFSDDKNRIAATNYSKVGNDGIRNGLIPPIQILKK